ncbi:MAG: inverse autotransporter beta domain-containing protein [Chlamydia suis]|nr:inverse autotransporter beta domain-containing protein [Chlamydia suis]
MDKLFAIFHEWLLRASSPRHSSLQPNYQESPAHGLDFRLHYWLPFFPRLGGKIFYEQYFGKQVSLFGRSDLQHDPFVITTGVEFTPFPLLSMEIDHRMSKASRHYTLFNIRLNYRFGESLSSQLNPFSVAKMRFLNENRYNFVSRNHVIVFNYSEYTYDIFVSPASISAIEFASSTVSLKCPNTKTLAHFEWEAQNFIEAGGEITLVSAGKSNAEYTVKLPPHKLRLSSQRRTVPTNEYTLQVFAVDTSGQRSKTGTLSITVSQDPQVSIDRKYFLNGVLAQSRSFRGESSKWFLLFSLLQRL